MPTRQRKKVLSDQTTVYTIWDNLARHERELRKLGAKPDQLARLREAAQAVDTEEAAAASQAGRNPAFNKRDLAGIIAPYACCNDWIIQPPSPVAHRWAYTAASMVTGGREPTTSVGTLNVLVAGLLILKLYGDGEKAKVLEIISTDTLADLLPDACNAFAGCSLDAIALDYITLMGLEKKTPPATHHYRQILQQIRRTLSAPPTTPSSSSTSQPASADSAPTGDPTSKPPRRSSKPSPGKPAGRSR